MSAALAEALRCLTWIASHGYEGAPDIAMRRAAKDSLAMIAAMGVGPRPMSDEAKTGETVLVYFKQYGWLAVRWLDPWDEQNCIWCVDDHKHGPYMLRGYNEGDDTHWMERPPAPEEGQ